MQPSEAAAIASAAKAASPPAASLEEALAHHPERVRVVHMGPEFLGAFVLSELPKGVEEISGLAFSDAGRSAGAERAAIEYVVGAARFARKKAVEVVAAPGSAESRHLEREGFKRAGKRGPEGERFRIEVKP